MTPPPKVQIQSEHAKVTCKKNRERYKAKIEGYVPRFHTKYFNHAISVILPFLLCKNKKPQVNCTKATLEASVGKWPKLLMTVQAIATKLLSRSFTGDAE